MVFASAALNAAQVIDQKNDGPYFGGFTLSAAPIGQSFVPNLNSLDFVELLINDQNPGFGSGVNVAVNIRANDLNGSILGTSNTVLFHDQIPQLFQEAEVVHFNFSSPVALSAGLTYLIEPVRVAGGSDSSDLGVLGTFWQTDAYPSGQAYFQGAVYNGAEAPFDLWFREGITVVPIPASVWLFASSILALLNARPRKREVVL